METKGFTSRTRTKMKLGQRTDIGDDYDRQKDHPDQKDFYKPFWEKIEMNVFSQLGGSGYTDETTYNGLEVLFSIRPIDDDVFANTVSRDLT